MTVPGLSASVGRGTPEASLILLMAGSGERLGGISKAFSKLHGKPLYRHSLDLFLSKPFIHQVILTVRRIDIPKLPQRFRHTKLGSSTTKHNSRRYDLSEREIVSVLGGRTRQDSVRAAMSYVTRDLVFIHDASRPILPPSLPELLLKVLKRNDGAVPILPLVDTLLAKSKNGFRAFEREGLFRVQTPQLFKTSVLRSCLDRTQPSSAMSRKDNKSEPAFTDESTLLLHFGKRVALVAGSPANLKITYPEDLAFARYLCHAGPNL